MRALFQRMRDMLRDKRGALSVITAISGLVLLGFTAGAVDFGSVFLKERQLQGMADLAAMAAASNLNEAQKAADETAKANDWSSPVTATVVTGNYTADATLAAAQRFAAGGSSPDAARVTLKSSADLYFASLLLGRSSLPISRSATAARAELAGFSLGTRLASLNGGMANALLSALTGSSVNLSVMDYNALANARVDLFQYANALKARANVTAASFNDTLNSNGIGAGRPSGAACAQPRYLRRGECDGVARHRPAASELAVDRHHRQERRHRAHGTSAALSRCEGRAERRSGWRGERRRSGVG
ncbi:MAG TPA: pilus assembly protein TadG-related protein [Rhizomicrobium sp.]